MKDDYLNPPELHTLAENKELLEDNYVKSFLGITYSLFLKGLAKEEIKRQLQVISQDRERILTEEELLTLVNTQRKNILEEYDKDREYTISLHLQRYNDEIENQLNIDTSEMNKYRAREVKNYAYLQCLEILFQKEKLIGLHTKGIQLRINNTTKVKASYKRKRYRTDLLTLAELIEMNSLIEKCKKNQEIEGIIMRGKVETEDIDHEEIKEVEVPNIENIKFKELPEGLIQQEPPKTFLEVENKLRETLRKAAEEKFKKTKGK